MSNNGDLAKQLDEAIASSKQDQQWVKENTVQRTSDAGRQNHQVEKKKKYPSRIYILLIAISFIAYILLSAPTGIALTKIGKPNGLINVLKEVVQGQSFWQSQEKAIVKKISTLIRQPAEDAKIEKEMAGYAKESRRDDELFYKQNPDMRPSPAERAAEALREKADIIEDQQLKKELEKDRQDELVELKQMLKITREKVSDLAQ